MIGLRISLFAVLTGAFGCGERPAEERAIFPSDSSPIRTSGLQAGGGAPHLAAANPYEGDQRALAEGRRYYLWMNCHGCHGELGGGGIGPPLADRAWIYGSAPENIYQTILQGRPNGMPAYAGVIPEDRVWLIAAYVRSLGPPDARELQEGSPTRLPGSPPEQEAARKRDPPADREPPEERVTPPEEEQEEERPPRRQASSGNGGAAEGLPNEAAGSYLADRSLGEGSS